MKITDKSYDNLVNNANKVATIGSYVIATLYELRHKYGVGNEKRKAKVIRYTTQQQMLEGYRFGVIVEYEDKKYWVDVDDIERIGYETDEKTSN